MNQRINSTSMQQSTMHISSKNNFSPHRSQPQLLSTQKHLINQLQIIITSIIRLQEKKQQKIAPKGEEPNQLTIQKFQK